MNITSFFESWGSRLDYLENHRIYPTDEKYVSLVKGNVTEHVATLLSPPSSQNVIEAAQYMTQSVGYPAAVASNIEHCTVCTYTNITHMEDITEMDALDYYWFVGTELGYCLFQEDSAVTKYRNKPDCNIFQFMILSMGPLIVLLGPYATELDRIKQCNSYEWLC